MRRSLIRLAAVILVESCAFPMPSNAATRVESLGRVQSSGSRANGWPQTFFDAAHTGYNPRETIISPSNVSQLQLLWGYPVPGEISALVLENGRIYAQSSGPASHGPILVALDASTGALVWTIAIGETGNVAQQSIAAIDRRVFTNCTSYPYHQGVCAYDACTGKREWIYSIGCSSKTPACALWQYPYSENGSYENAFPAALARNLLYATGSNDDVYALRSGSGSMLWAAIPGDSAPSIANGVLYVNRTSSASGAAAVAAYGASNRASLWTGPSFRISYAPITPPIVANGILYVSNATCGGVCAYGLPPSNLRASQPRKPNAVTEHHKRLVANAFEASSNQGGSFFDILAADAEWTIVGTSPAAKTYLTRPARPSVWAPCDASAGVASYQ